MSADFATTTRAIRAGVTNGQLRQTKAWRRLGKCGNETGLGAAPFGKSATATADDLLPTSAEAGQTEAPSASPPAAAELALRKFRREQWVDRDFMG